MNLPPSHSAHILTPRVAVITVNYDSAEYLHALLQSVSRLTYKNYSVIVVENASPSGFPDALAAEIRASGYDLIIAPDNLGFAGANNLGIHYARICDAEYVWLLNPDVVVDPESLSVLVATALREGDAAFASKVLAGDPDPAIALKHISLPAAERPPGRIWSAGGTIDYAKQVVDMRGYGELDDGRFDAESDCDYLPGCALFAPMTVLDRVGPMPEEFFMYFEETEWCTRMKKAGAKLRYQPKSIVWHLTRDEKMQGASTVYYYNRNFLYFWYDHGTLRTRLNLLWSTLREKLPSALRALREAPNPAMREVFRAHGAACFDFLRGKKGRR